MEPIGVAAREKGVELHETIHHGRRIQWLRAIGNYIITSDIPTPPLSYFPLFCSMQRPPSAPRVHSCVQRREMEKKLGQIIMSSRDNKMVRRQNGAADLNATAAAALAIITLRGRARSLRRADNCGPL